MSYYFLYKNAVLFQRLNEVIVLLRRNIKRRLLFLLNQEDSRQPEEGEEADDIGDRGQEDR